MDGTAALWSRAGDVIGIIRGGYIRGYEFAKRGKKSHSEIALMKTRTELISLGATALALGIGTYAFSSPRSEEARRLRTAFHAPRHGRRHDGFGHVGNSSRFCRRWRSFRSFISCS